MPITPALVPEAADAAKERTFPFWGKGGNVCNRRNPVTPMQENWSKSVVKSDPPGAPRLAFRHIAEVQ